MYKRQVAFDRNNNFLGTATHTETNKLIEGDYQYICEIIRHRVGIGQPLTTITGLNKVLQIRTKDSKDRNGNYHPIIWEGKQISNKGYAFYLTGRYAKGIIWYQTTPTRIACKGAEMNFRGDSTPNFFAFFKKKRRLPPCRTFSFSVIHPTSFAYILIIMHGNMDSSLNVPVYKVAHYPVFFI